MMFQLIYMLLKEIKILHKRLILSDTIKNYFYYLKYYNIKIDDSKI